MQKATLIVVLLAAGLLGYLAFRKSDEVETPKSTTISGYLPVAVQEDFRRRKDNPLLFLNEKEEDRKKLFAEAAWDEIAITKQSAAGTPSTVVMKKEGTAEWKLAEPLPGEVEGYRTKAMMELFATDTALDTAQVVKDPTVLEDFGLDAKRSIRVTIKEKGLVKVDLIVGNSKKLERPSEDGADVYDTFVMLPSASDVVYTARRKDLRQPFEVELAELRSKKVFNFDLTEITKVTIENPTDKAAAKIVLSAAWADKKDEKKDGEAKPEEKDPITGEAKKPEKEGTFSLAEPQVAGFALMEMRSYWSSLAGIRVNEYVMEKPGPDTGLVGDAVAKAPKITVELASGKKQTLIFGAEKEPKKTYYAMLEGAAEYMLVSDFTKNNLVKKLVELRDKNILGANDDADITAVKLSNEHTTDGPMVFERDGAGWKMTPPLAAQATLGASIAPDESEVKALVSGIRYLRVTDFLTEAPKLDDVGLTTPAYRIEATIKGATKTLLIGSVEKDSKVTAMIEGTDLYFTLGSWTRDKFKKAPIDFKNKRILDVKEAEVASIELTHGPAAAPTESIRLERVEGKTDAWKMTAPEAIDAATGLDDTIANALARGFDAFDVKGFSDKPKDGVGLTAPAFTFTATLKDGTTRRLFVSDTLDGEAHFVSLEAPGIDPNGVFTLEKFRVTNLRKKLTDLKPPK
jgi:hypothetical protein